MAGEFCKEHEKIKSDINTQCEKIKQNREDHNKMWDAINRKAEDADLKDVREALDTLKFWMMGVMATAILTMAMIVFKG